MCNKSLIFGKVCLPKTKKQIENCISLHTLLNVWDNLPCFLKKFLEAKQKLRGVNKASALWDQANLLLSSWISVHRWLWRCKQLFHLCSKQRTFLNLQRKLFCQESLFTYFHIFFLSRRGKITEGLNYLCITRSRCQSLISIMNQAAALGSRGITTQYRSKWKNTVKK